MRGLDGFEPGTVAGFDQNWANLRDRFFRLVADFDRALKQHDGDEALVCALFDQFLKENYTARQVRLLLLRAVADRVLGGVRVGNTPDTGSGSAPGV